MTLGNQWNVSWVRKGHRSTDMRLKLCEVKALKSFDTEYDSNWDKRNLSHTNTVYIFVYPCLLY